ncbi:holin [Thomasclavelia cocleata]|uniref:Toxin secretion/phage lysis holin n=1 Tax=Thomasclavelia cocleata TaxID=69824 RepID=A0A1I0FLY1_9FIRM|nr:phage holin family protein [Thomasclavelia cocleata]MCR1961045.1 phage holin family protein [Thomasclavelia cocleata]NDO41191.1 phage holin family protein [Thomasclavelia cocleata]PJN80499.1 holin [Thomasclavelia cocleata]SET58280.1 toxin secretion/phage lysis holin [Thomasclavelia cocleata]
MDNIFEYLKYVYSLIIAMLSCFLGEHWILFILYLTLNIIDTFTGWAKARILNKESSKVAMIGIIRKMCYWVLILVAFLIPIIFQEIGSVIGIDFSVTIILGWFVVASLIINECRSILENLVEAGCQVPNFLIKGLEVTAKKLEEIEEKENE